MAARAIGSGTISFGLVSIPFKLYTAASSQNVSFNLLHKKCGGRMKQQYRKNIQIAELNAINAGLAVLRYKQVRGFYQDDGAPYHLLFGLGDLRAFGEVSL